MRLDCCVGADPVPARGPRLCVLRIDRQASGSAPRDIHHALKTGTASCVESERLRARRKLHLYGTVGQKEVHAGAQRPCDRGLKRSDTGGGDDDTGTGRPPGNARRGSDKVTASLCVGPLQFGL